MSRRSRKFIWSTNEIRLFQLRILLTSTEYLFGSIVLKIWLECFIISFRAKQEKIELFQRHCVTLIVICENWRATLKMNLLCAWISISGGRFRRHASLLVRPFHILRPWWKSWRHVTCHLFTITITTLQLFL